MLYLRIWQDKKNTVFALANAPRAFSWRSVKSGRVAITRTGGRRLKTFLLCPPPPQKKKINYRVSRPWQSVSDEVIKHSFKAYGIALSLDGSEDARLNDRMAEEVNAANQRRAENCVRVG